METFIVKTEKTVFGGNTIAKINGKAVFIPYSMPEETLEIRKRNGIVVGQLIEKSVFISYDRIFLELQCIFNFRTYAQNVNFIIIV